MKEILESLDEMGLIDFDELIGEYKTQEKGCSIYIDTNRCEIHGATPMILTLFCKLCETIVEEVKGVNKEKLQEAFDMAFKSEEEIDKMTLEELKKVLEKMKKELEEKESKNE